MSHDILLGLLLFPHSPAQQTSPACIHMYVCVVRTISVVPVLFLCIIVYHFQAMYECVYVFVLYCIIVLYYYYITVYYSIMWGA